MSGGRGSDGSSESIARQTLFVTCSSLASLPPPKGHPLTTGSGKLFYFLLYNSYYDLLLQILLGYGMVLLLMEEAGRENADARVQLSMAHDRLKQISLYDPLTGALNRRAYEEGAGLDALAARYGTAVVLDMDNLKLVNDAHGHAAGDALLRRLVETLRGCVRPLDRIYRWAATSSCWRFRERVPRKLSPACAKDSALSQRSR